MLVIKFDFKLENHNINEKSFILLFSNKVWLKTN